MILFLLLLCAIANAKISVKYESKTIKKHFFIESDISFSHKRLFVFLNSKVKAGKNIKIIPLAFEVASIEDKLNWKNTCCGIEFFNKKGSVSFIFNHKSFRVSLSLNISDRISAGVMVDSNNFVKAVEYFKKDSSDSEEKKTTPDSKKTIQDLPSEVVNEILEYLAPQKEKDFFKFNYYISPDDFQELCKKAKKIREPLGRVLHWEFLPKNTIQPFLYIRYFAHIWFENLFFQEIVSPDYLYLKNWKLDRERKDIVFWKEVERLLMLQFIYQKYFSITGIEGDILSRFIKNLELFFINNNINVQNKSYFITCKEIKDISYDYYEKENYQVVMMHGFCYRFKIHGDVIDRQAFLKACKSNKERVFKLNRVI